MNDTDALTAGDTASSEQPATHDLPIAPAGPPPGMPVMSGAAGEDPASTRSQRTVPYGALAEERARRKELQRELHGAVEAQQRLQGRLDLLHDLAQRQAAQRVESDPATASTDRVDEGRLEMPPETGQNSDTEVQADAAFRTQLMHSVREVMHARPDFLAAYQHARQVRVAELVALGYAPHEALGITFDNEREIIRNAYANGHNPAQVIYDYAQRHGYGGGSGARQPLDRPAAAPNRAGILSDAEKVALAARGQAGAKSLSTAGGGSSGSLTLEALASMSDEEFAEATKGDRWQKLLKS